MIVYQRHQTPGCGGCLLILMLLLLATGGVPLLVDVLGALALAFLVLILVGVAAVTGFFWYIRWKVSQYERSQTEAHNLFVFLLVHILVRIAQLDGTVTRQETATILSFFREHLGYGQSQIYWVKDLIRQATASSVSLEDLLAEFAANFGYEPRLILLELVYRVLFANPTVTPAEVERLAWIADFLHVSPYDHQSIRARYVSGAARTTPDAKENRCFETLGLAPGATFEEIKRAYRTLSMQYHPDKVNHLGEEFRKVAEEKMKEINEAYQYLKERYG